MPASKRINISIPTQLLSEVDRFMALDNKNRSEVVREAISLYLSQRKRDLIIERMKRGYLEMAEININIASESFILEEEAFGNYAEKMLG